MSTGSLTGYECKNCFKDVRKNSRVIVIDESDSEKVPHELTKEEYFQMTSDDRIGLLFFCSQTCADRITHSESTAMQLEPKAQHLQGSHNGNAAKSCTELKSVVAPPHSTIFRVCETCDGMKFVNDQEWKVHVSSESHRNRISSLNRNAKLVNPFSKNDENRKKGSAGIGAMRKGPHGTVYCQLCDKKFQTQYDFTQHRRGWTHIQRQKAQERGDDENGVDVRDDLEVAKSNKNRMRDSDHDDGDEEEQKVFLSFGKKRKRNLQEKVTIFTENEDEYSVVNERSVLHTLTEVDEYPGKVIEVQGREEEEDEDNEKEKRYILDESSWNFLLNKIPYEELNAFNNALNNYLNDRSNWKLPDAKVDKETSSADQLLSAAFRAWRET